MNVSKSTEFHSFKISLEDIRTVVNRLFDHIIVTRGENEITIDRVFYWETGLDELFDMEKEPNSFDVGSLSDDWEFLSSLLKPDAIPIARQLDHLSVLFRFIARRLGDKFAAEGG
jgi:hypothetical protein